MLYAFDKHKLPRGLSFPLNRSLLDAALIQAAITRVYCVYYWLRQSGDIVLRAIIVVKQTTLGQLASQVSHSMP